MDNELFLYPKTEDDDDNKEEDEAITFLKLLLDE